MAIKPMVVAAQQRALVAGILGAAREAGLDQSSRVRMHLFVETVERLVATYDAGRSETIQGLLERLVEFEMGALRPIVLERPVGR